MGSNMTVGLPLFAFESATTTLPSTIASDHRREDRGIRGHDEVCLRRPQAGWVLGVGKGAVEPVLDDRLRRGRIVRCHPLHRQEGRLRIWCWFVEGRRERRVARHVTEP